MRARLARSGNVEAISNVKTQRFAVRSIAWLDDFDASIKEQTLGSFCFCGSLLEALQLFHQFCAPR